MSREITLEVKDETNISSIDSNNALKVKSQKNVPPDFKTTFASLAGNILEWYDFVIFGLFSDILGDTFFPPNQKGDASLVEAFVVYALAFLARPIGGAILGKMGDKHGRKGALETSTFGMAFATFMIGCFPTYEMIGYYSTLLLTLARFLQGLYLGGQFISVMLFTLEQRDCRTWGFWGAIVNFVAKIGAFLGSFLTAVLRELLTEDQIKRWGWRVPFWLGAFGALPAMYLKLKVKEYEVNSFQTPSPLSSNEKDDENNVQESQICFETESESSTDAETEIKSETNEQRDPLKEALSMLHRRPLIASFLVPSLYSAINYLIFVWLPIFMNSIIDPPIPHAFEINSINMVLVGMVFTVVGGWFADWYDNHSKLMIMSCIICGLSSPLAFTVIGAGGSKYETLVAFLVQFYLSMFLAIFSGAMIPWLVHNVPSGVRLTIISIGLNATSSIWGGFTPLTATILANQVNNIAPGYMLTVAAIFSIVGVKIIVKPTVTNDLRGRESFTQRADLNPMEDANVPLLA